MENDVKEENKKKNVIIGVLVCVIVLLVAALVYFLFVKNDKPKEPVKPQDNQQIENKTKDEYGLLGKSFKTKDGKINLRIVDKDDKKAYDDAKNVYYDLDNGKHSYNNDDVIYYGYLNNDVIEIKRIKKVDHYLAVFTELPSASNILINMRSNIIDEDDSRLLLNNYDRFFGDTGTNWYDVIKVNDGYFITSHNPADENNLYTIFTTQWKKIGYYNDHNLKYENDGIYAFDNDKLTGSLNKYSVNGEKISNKSNSDTVAKGVYKTTDGKFTLKIIDNKTAYLNDKLFIIFDIKDDSKYAHYHGDFDGEDSQSGYNFLVDKEKGIIVEGDTSNVKNLNDRMLRFYGEGDLSKNINFIKCAAGYYFVDDFAIEGSIVEIYTTDWKLLGYVDIDNIKSDKDGVYVYEDYEPFDKLVGNPTKYDINGNKIN